MGIFPTLIDNFVCKKNSDINKMSSSNIYDFNNILSKCNAVIKPGALKIYDYEKYVYEYCVKNNIPYLGICAGMQLMSNYENNYPNNIIKNTNDLHSSKENYCHYVNIIKDTLLYNILKKDRILVNSKHKYHIDNSGVMTPCCYSDDGIIEGIYNKNALFHLGLQWHPELLNDENSENIFINLIENAKILRK